MVTIGLGGPAELGGVQERLAWAWLPGRWSRCRLPAVDLDGQAGPGWW